ncbi:uncharacterized protein LOC101743345 [Bombyx mori]|uniref:Uncharacterized protein n=1 Tax=Bombyx mori TaxID=7091 RepID=A0A8R1WHL1_BOMMO|nr:uncharacterized protein LOC101743345 [Bombyx mori]
MIVDTRIILPLSVYIFGSCYAATEEETYSKIEYIQIFKNIPALFEYLLEMLETRPEILERNDVTVFVKNKQNLKRDVRESLIHENDANLKKQNIIPKTNELKRDTMYVNTNNRNTKKLVRSFNGKRKTLNDFAKEREPDIVRHEYGNSIKHLDGHNEDKHIDGAKLNTVSKRDNLTPVTDTSVELNTQVKDFFNDNINMFGFNLHYLSPEEVERQMLTVEQMLEEHNSKDDKQQE